MQIKHAETSCTLGTNLLISITQKAKNKMLKITVQASDSRTTLLLEGKLAGAWVPEVETCWTAERGRAQEFCVDLGGVSFVDADGRALLIRLHQAGAVFVATGCLTRAIIAEVTRLASEESDSSGAAPRGKKTSLIVMFFLLLAGSQAARAQEHPTVHLTLHDAVALALKQNPQVQIAILQSAQIVQDQNIARAGFLPQVRLNSSIAVERGNIETAFGKPFPGFPEHIGPFEVFAAGPQFSMPILDLTLWRRWQLARENTSAARADQMSVREQVTLLTVSQYLGALRAGAEVRAAETRVSLAQALFDQATDLQKSGAGTGIDTLRANVELQNEKQRLLSSRTAHDIALYGLARLLSLDPKQAIELTDEMSFFETHDFAVEESLELAYKARPEMQQLEANLRSAAVTKQAASDSRLPVLMGMGSWNYEGLSINTGIPVYQYQIGMSVPLFTGGRIRAEITRTDLEIQKIQHRRDDLRNQIALEVKTAIAELDSARNQVTVANLGVQLAQEEVSQARDRFGAGVANNIEVVQAQDALGRANDNQIAALYQYNQARADLARAVGQMESLFSK